MYINHTQGHGKPEAYHNGLGAQCGGHPRQGSDPLQGKIPHTHTPFHTLRTILKSFTYANNTYHSSVGAWGEHEQESNPRLWRCEPNMARKMVEKYHQSRCVKQGP